MGTISDESALFRTVAVSTLSDEDDDDDGIAPGGINGCVRRESRRTSLIETVSSV